MSEDNTKNPDADSTNPLPFEEFVRQQLVALSTQMNGLREEMVERFLQLSRQIRELDLRVGRVEEEIGKVRADLSRQIKDLDQKVMCSSKNKFISRMTFANCVKRGSQRFE